MQQHTLVHLGPKQLRQLQGLADTRHCLQTLHCAIHRLQVLLLLGVTKRGQHLQDSSVIK